jgi:beta-phosphoglucomutase-like phosphatase (HAD superfamily)
MRCFAASSTVEAMIELDTVTERWEHALDAADGANGAAMGLDERVRRRDVARERHTVAELLARLARETNALAPPWLAPFPVTPRLLGLPDGTRACLFALDGVLTDSNVVHALAWSEALDPFLLQLANRLEWRFVPFEPSEYATYVAGRPRLEGIHMLLASRGIEVSDETARELALRKGEALERVLHRRGVSAQPGARRYLEAAGHADVARVVFSASSNTRLLLEHARLAPLVDATLERPDASLLDCDTARTVVFGDEASPLRSLLDPRLLAA